MAHCLRPETLDAALAETPDAVGAAVVSPTYFGAVADVAALAEVAHGHGVPLVVDEAWGAHLAFSDELPAARPVAGRRPGHLEHPQDRRQPDPVGDGAPGTGRPDRRGRGRPLRDAGRVDQPERAAGGVARQRPARGGRGRAGAAARVAARARAHARGGARGAGAGRAGRAAGGGGGGVRLRPAAADDRRARDALERVRAGAAAARAGRAPGAGRRERDGGGVRDGRGHGDRPASGWWRRCTGRSRR